MSTLIAEDLLLVLLDDGEGRVDLGMRPKLDAGLAAAVLAELALEGVVSVTDAHGMFHPAEVRVEHADSVTDPVLRGALTVIAEKHRSAKTLVGKLAHGLRGALLAELGQAHKVVPHENVADDIVKKRSAELAEGGWATEGLRKALQAATIGALAGAGVI